MEMWVNEIKQAISFGLLEKELNQIRAILADYAVACSVDSKLSEEAFNFLQTWKPQ